MNNYSSFFILHYALTKVVAGFGRGLFFVMKKTQKCVWPLKGFCIFAANYGSLPGGPLIGGPLISELCKVLVFNILE